MSLTKSFARFVNAAMLLAVLSVAAIAADPGIPIPDPSLRPVVNDQIPGFLLIYNYYTSSLTNPATQNTKFSITNTDDNRGYSVHLFFVEGSTCAVADRYLCLTPNQTMTFTAAEQDPGTTGYLVALLSDSEGFPRFRDVLIGDAFVKTQVGFFGNLTAEAISEWSTDDAAVAPDQTLVTLALTGLPRVLAVDNIGSRADGNESLLVVNGVGGDLRGSINAVGNLFGILYDDAEEAHSWNRPSNGCQLVASLNNDFPRTSPRFDVVIPAGQTGWMKFWSTSTVNNTPFGTSTDGRALLGAIFQRNSNVGIASGAFQGARNLHKLNLVSTPSGNIAVFAPDSLKGRSGIAQVQPNNQVTLFTFPIFPSSCGFDEGSDR